MDKLKINFVAHGGAYLASHRMRVSRPAELLNVGVTGVITTVTQQALPEADVNIFNKHFDMKNSYMAALAGKSLGYYTIFDVCDDHFGREHGEFYSKMCQEVDLITCNSKKMKERILEVTKKTARVIPDPITFPNLPPKSSEMIKQTKEPSFLWFGHGSNAPALKEWIPHFKYKLTCISDAPIHHPNIDFVEWKPMLVEKRIVDADIILLPTTKHPWTKYKSPNRAVDALNSGKFVITDNEDIYGELRDFITIIKSTEELPEAINFWNNNPEKVVEMISRGQEYVRKNYSDSVILDGWLGALKDLKLIKNFRAA